MKIQIEDTNISKIQLPNKLGFGKFFTDRIFSQKYDPDKGWSQQKIAPAQENFIPPTSQIFHNGQNIFEGIKAFLSKSGQINVLRLNQHLERFNKSAKRLCMPEIPLNLHSRAICQLLHAEKLWMPKKEGSSMYIRPVMIAIDQTFEVRSSEKFLHYIVLSPVDSFFDAPLAPISVWICDEFVRAVRGGTGNIKTSANYAGSIFESERAKRNGYDQVLWLDALERKYIEEVGAMNIMFVKNNDEIVTPKLNGSILPGITRGSIIELASSLKLKIKEEKLEVYRLLDEISSGIITECFAVGTAVTVVPINRLGFRNNEYKMHATECGPITRRIYKKLVSIQQGKLSIFQKWLTKI